MKNWSTFAKVIIEIKVARIFLRYGVHKSCCAHTNKKIWQ